jgi:hypothetical protein
VWGVGGVKKQRSAVGTALCGAFVLANNSPHPAEMHRSGFWVPFATKRYKQFKIQNSKCKMQNIELLFGSIISFCR